MVEPMELKYTLSQSEIMDGDIICFQAEVSDQEARELESQGLYSDAQRFYNLLQRRLVEPDKIGGSPVKSGNSQEVQNVIPGV